MSCRLVSLIVIALAGLARADDPDRAIEFDLTEPAQASLALYGGDGRMVREFHRAEPLPAGRHVLAWDGLDSNGLPVAPGRYAWKLLTTQGLKSEYVCTVGTSFGHHFWAGNHSGPLAVAADETGFYAAANAEGMPALAKAGYDKTVLWQAKETKPGLSTLDLAVSGSRLFVLSNDGTLSIRDANTGEHSDRRRPQRDKLPSTIRTVRRFVLGGDPTRTVGGDTVQVPLAAYTPERKFGWEDVSGLRPADPTGRVPGHAYSGSATKVFLVDLPPGKYGVRVVGGDPTRACAPLEVAVGKPVSSAHRANPGKHQWYLLPTIPTGQSAAKHFPQLHEDPRLFDSKDGVLRIEFTSAAKGDDGHWAVREIEILSAAERVDAGPDELLVAYPSLGLVAWLDPLSAVAVAEVPVPKVRDVARIGPGRSLALTSSEVLEVSREKGGKPRVAATGLRNPVGIAADPNTGVFLVAEGAPNHQVNKFSADGQLAGVFGKSGGRTQGMYQSNDFLGISDIAVAPDGGFFVAEPRGAIRRIARFTPSGELVGEWFGGQMFYSFSEFDPDDPLTMWLIGHPGTVVQVHIDLDSRSWKPVAWYDWQSQLDPTLFPPMRAYKRLRVLRAPISDPAKRELLFWHEGYPGLLMVLDEAKSRVRPLAGLTQFPRKLTDPKAKVSTGDFPPCWVETVRRLGLDPLAPSTRSDYGVVAWADANGDGRVDPNELRLGPIGKQTQSLRHSALIDVDLNLYVTTNPAEQSGPWVRFPVNGRTAIGTPIWDPKRTETSRPAPWRELVQAERDTVGHFYQVFRGGGEGFVARTTYSPEAHGWGWPANLTDATGLVKANAAGNVLWQVMPKAARIPHPRGQVNRPVALNGFVRGCVAVGDQLEHPCEFWTEDGLYVGGLFDRRADDGLPDAVYTWMGLKKRVGSNKFPEMSLFQADDMLMAGSLAQLPDGTVLFAGAGPQGRPVYKVTGWDRFRTRTGTVRVNEPGRPAAGTGTGLWAKYFRSADLAGAPLNQGIATEVWFGDDKHPWPMPAAKSAYWTGAVEPRFSEAYTFGVYATGSVKLWIDGKPVELEEADMPRGRNVLGKWFSVPVPLQAGRRHAIRLEWLEANGKSPPPKVHLCWESLSQPIGHIPTVCLYPESE